MFVILFNESVSFGLPSNMPFTGSLDRLELALSRVTANGLTALYDAVAAGIHHLEKGDRDKKVLIVISDGGDNASKHKLNEILSLAGQSEAIIYTIAIFDETDPDRNTRALKQLANATGGESFLPSSTREIISICKQIAHDIRGQYSIAYQSTNKKEDGSYRTIQVRAGSPERRRLFVRTRAGYYATLKPKPVPAIELRNEDPD